MKTLAILTTLTLSIAAASADKIIPETFTITATASVQNANVTVSGTTSTVPAPVKHTVTTASLLATLAEDEYYEGNYNLSFFPAGAKIVFMAHENGSQNSYFVVTDSKGNFLCNVDDLLKFYPVNDADVMQGKENNVNGLLSNWTELYVGTLYFDDTGAGGTTQLYFGGIVTVTVNDVVGKNSTYTETVKGTMTSGIGTGKWNGQDAIISGTASASGSAAINF